MLLQEICGTNLVQLTTASGDKLVGHLDYSGFETNEEAKFLEFEHIILNSDGEVVEKHSVYVNSLLVESAMVLEEK